MKPQDAWNGLDQQIRSFLTHHAPREQHHRIHGTDAIPGLDLGRIDPAVVVVDIDSVVGHRDLPVRDVVHPHHLVLERGRHRNHAVRPIRSSPFLEAHAGRLPAPKVVSAAAVLGRVDGEHSLPAALLLDPDHGVGSQPIVRVHHVKRDAHVVLGPEYVADKRAAHLVHFVHEASVQRKRTAVIVHSVDPLVLPLTLAHAGVNVYFVALPLQGRRQLGDVDAHAPYGDRVEGLPTKHCNSHKKAFR